MAALDTNVVIRLIMGDDLRQANAAEKLVASEPCTVAPSVLLECEWVLRAGYGLTSAVIAAAMHDFLQLENIAATDQPLVQRVLHGYAAGLDFADTLHAAQASEGESFATFDRQFVKRAPKAGLSGVKLVSI